MLALPRLYRYIFRRIIALVRRRGVSLFRCLALQVLPVQVLGRGAYVRSAGSPVLAALLPFAASAIVLALGRHPRITNSLFY